MFLRLLTLALFIGFFKANAQGGDLPTSNPLKIGALNNETPVGAPAKPNSLNMPSVIDIKPDAEWDGKPKENEVRMLPEKTLKQAGEDMVIDVKMPRYYDEKNNPHYHFPDQYLGDLKTTSEYLLVKYIDHQAVDGDHFRILHNDIIVEEDILLTGTYRHVQINLDIGFNKIDFVALNEGEYSPNTGLVKVYDDKGKRVYNTEWMISAGSTATLVIVREEK